MMNDDAYPYRLTGPCKESKEATKPLKVGGCWFCIISKEENKNNDNAYYNPLFITHYNTTPLSSIVSTYHIYIYMYYHNPL